MKYIVRVTPSLRFGVAVFLSVAIAMALAPQRALGQAQLTVDFTYQTAGPETAGTLNSTVAPTANSGTTTITAAANTPYVIDVWVVVTDPGVADTNLGIQYAWLNAVSTNGGTGAAFTSAGVVGGAATSTSPTAVGSESTGTGFTNTRATDYNDIQYKGPDRRTSPSGSEVPGSWSGTGTKNGSFITSGNYINIGDNTNQNDSAFANYGQAGGPAQLGGGNAYDDTQNPGGDGPTIGVPYIASGGNSTTGGWAFFVGTLTYEGTGTPGAGSQTIFSPQVPTWNATTNLITVNGGTSLVSANYVAGSTITFAGPALIVGPTPAMVDNSGLPGANNVGFNATPVTFAVAGSGGSFDNLASQVTTTSQEMNGGGGVEGTVIPGGEIATILMGENTGGATNVGMAWRTRYSNEVPTNDGAANGSGFTNNTTNPTYGVPLSGLPLISDVLDLYGMNTPGTSNASTLTGVNTVAQTDPFALQMTLNPKTLLAEGAGQTTYGDRGNVYIASLIGGVWVNSIYGDTFPGVTGTSQTTVNGHTFYVGSDAYAGGAAPFLGAYGGYDAGSYQSFEYYEQNVAENPLTLTDANLNLVLGSWGVDAADNVAWTIVDHNSEFAIVPEPSSIVLAAFGLLGGALALRRKKATG